MQRAVKKVLLRLPFLSEVAAQLELHYERGRDVHQAVDLGVCPGVRRRIDDAHSADDLAVARHDRRNRVSNAVWCRADRIQHADVLSVANEHRPARRNDLSRETERQRNLAPDPRSPRETDAALHDVPVVIEQRNDRHRRAQRTRSKTSDPVERLLREGVVRGRWPARLGTYAVFCHAVPALNSGFHALPVTGHGTRSDSAYAAIL